jgi:hypothetical protein
VALRPTLSDGLPFSIRVTTTSKCKIYTPRSFESQRVPEIPGIPNLLFFLRKTKVKEYIFKFTVNREPNTVIQTRDTENE